MRKRDSRKNNFKKALLLLAVALLTACGGSKNDTASAGEGKSIGKGKAVLTVLTVRTDLNDTVFPEYAERFKKTHPEIKEIRFETSADYETMVKTRMSTKDYGDVLMIPTGIVNDDLHDFFTPIGTKAEIEKEYKGLSKISNGDVYGIPVNINAAGTIIYNKNVFEKAGIKTFPKTPDELYAASRKIKAIGVTPIYTNYSAKWPFAQWDDAALDSAKDRQYRLSLINDKAPFKPGKPYYKLYKVMYEIAKRGYIESDPITSDWEGSKQMLADGKVAMLVLASWAYPQVILLTDDKESIGIGMFPLPAEDGYNYLSVSDDYNLGVNVHTKYPELAKDFIHFFVQESGFVENYGVISPYKKAKNPEYIEELLASSDGHILENVYNPRPVEEAKLRDIQNNSGIDIENSYDFKQEIIDAGMQGRSFDAIMEDLNERWGREVAKN